jgi:hypothetical protein
MSLRDLAGKTRVALLWRSDCAPCVIELRNFAALEAAVGQGRLITIALEPAAKARAALARLGVKAHPAYAAAGDPQLFLEAVSNGGRRLPVSLALDRGGRICRFHVGLLGTDRVHEWAAQC